MNLKRRSAVTHLFGSLRLGVPLTCALSLADFFLPDLVFSSIRSWRASTFLRSTPRELRLDASSNPLPLGGRRRDHELVHGFPHPIADAIGDFELQANYGTDREQ